MSAPDDLAVGLLGIEVLVAVRARPELAAVEVVIRTEDQPETLLLAALNAKRLGERLTSVALNVLQAPNRRPEARR